ncbi:MAG TPA: RdgB/HAM1 family non-canonical purine NTP pyrophosphatase [Vicinamibacterales bacterium]|jgi:XTP/dITP diphosphohydrolase
MKLVVATTNPGKLREIVGILSDGGNPEHARRVEMISLDAFPHIAEPEETGATFAENARLKAAYYARETGLPSVADDSGLEIAALDNAPGVHSARWHGTDYEVKFRKIYEMLDARGARGSAARFVCRVALATRDGVIFEAEGVVEGTIADEPKGTNGFGYDPIFYYPPFGCTLAEIDLERKATVSHRGRAFAKLRDYLQSR